MTTLTTRYAFPKPELTDLVTDGWDAIADLADAVDVNLGNVADQAAADADAAAAASIARATIVALGDLLVGTGPGAVARLPRGAAGQQLKVAADGTLFWETPPATDLSSRVAKAGDAMTGELKMRNFMAVRLSPGAADVGSDPILFGVAGQVRLRQGTTGGALASLDAGAVYDNNARVYSAVNPPPATGGAVINQTIRGQASANVTIPTVNMAKTQVRMTSNTSYRGTISGSAAVVSEHLLLTGATVLTVSSPQGNTLSYELTEWS